MLVALGAAAFAVWLYLTFVHGRFWKADQRLENIAPPVGELPSVVAIIPARDEAEVIERSVASLLAQDYAGPLSIIVVDDHSDDGTAARARACAGAHKRGKQLQVIRAETRPPGWVGKMWAVHSGVARALIGDPIPDFLLLTDADVAHDPGNVRRLVAKAERSTGADRLQMVSLMVMLHCRSGWERLLIPAFVYFFQKLYPFPRSNDPRSRMAAAAGGCMLVRSSALIRSGGIAGIRDRVIDDCALARAVKSKAGPIWVGVTETEQSFRPYRGLHDIWQMVARSAYTQLHYSPFLLAGTVIGLLLVYVVPPALVLLWPYCSANVATASPAVVEVCTGSSSAGFLGLAAWGLMAWTYLPTLRMYNLNPLRAISLPIAGLLYLCMTIDSARLHWIGRGATWKGRAGAGAGPGAGPGAREDA